jgi:hypothetical protein
MKILTLLVISLLTLGVMAQDKGVTPLSVVNARMTAYNNHDLQAQGEYE